MIEMNDDKQVKGYRDLSQSDLDEILNIKTIREALAYSLRNQMSDKQAKGYRDLSQSEVDVINNIETTGEALGATVAALEELGSEIDQRWVAIGKTYLQQGIMALVRAVARPTTF